MNTATAGKTREWTYEELCDSCRQMNAEIDERRWLIGDTALAVETKYGEHTSEDFARDIGQNQSTIRNWKRVAKFYSQPFRAEQIERNPNLTYTYFRDALRIGDDKQIVADWLEEVSYNGWSADEASRKLTERLGHQTRESAEGTVAGTAYYDGKHHIEFVVSEDDLKWLREVDKVVIRAK